MEHCTRKPGDEKEIPEFGRDSIEQAMRLRIRATIEEVVKEERDAALGARKWVRVGEQRQGYRHGTRERTLTTSLGPATFEMPRARVRHANGTRTEWRSETVRRYERRTTRVDEAILGVYLAGGKSRPVKGALAPPAGGLPAVEGCGLAPGRSPARGLRDVADPRSGRRGSSLRVHGRLVSEGAHRWPPRACARARDAGCPGQWRAHRARPAARRRRECRQLDRGRRQSHGPSRGAARAGGHRPPSPADVCAPLALARHRDSAVYGAQVEELAVEGASAAARRAHRGLPPHDLRRDGRSH